MRYITFYLSATNPRENMCAWEHQVKALYGYSPGVSEECNWSKVSRQHSLDVIMLSTGAVALCEINVDAVVSTLTPQGRQ